MVTTWAKGILYSFYPKSSLAPLNLHLGYIFHTEWIYHRATFTGLLDFCKQYTQLTGARAICTIMTGENPKVRAGMKQENCSMEEFVQRVQQLSELATIGYHGHFWNDESKSNQDIFAIHTSTFVSRKLQEQFEKDLNWFQKHAVSHHGIYAGGWWFMNQYLAQKLLENSFQVDYSSSQAPYFYNAFSMNLMVQNSISAGESYVLKQRQTNKKLLCIQNLIGAHNSVFPLDFDRNLKNLDLAKNPIGVINAHDYDQSFTTTLKCIAHLIEDAKVTFCSHEKLVASQLELPLKEIPI